MGASDDGLPFVTPETCNLLLSVSTLEVFDWNWGHTMAALAAL